MKIRGILAEVVILFACGALMIGMFTYFTQQVTTESSIKKQTEEIASDIAEETDAAIKAYPAWKWLMEYWEKNAYEMDIPYDEGFGKGTETEKKARLLQEHQPQLQLHYARTADIKALPAEDQRLYAEIVYAWVINRLDEIKQAQGGLAFLFVVSTDEQYEKQFFLLSGANEGAVRGTAYNEVYTIGVTSGVNETQSEGMRRARETSRHLVDAGDYVDFYVYMGTVNDRIIEIGLTYDVTELNNNIERATIQGTVVAMILVLLMAWICLALIFRLVLQPLKTIQENIRNYKETKESAEVIRNLEGVRPPNEIGQLSEDVCDLTLEIDNYLEHIETITKERERISTELSLATRIQENVLPAIFPAFPDRSEFDLHASTTPAREIGGDFYDFFLTDDDHLCMIIADVSGKGIPAAMFMMSTKIILKSKTTSGRSPAKIMREANEMICASNDEDMFVTVWLGVLEISTGKLTAVNAGHEYPAITGEDGKFEVFKDKHGMMIGGIEGVKYTEYEMDIRPGQRLFFYTDGVPEATNSDNEMFGTDRMIDALNQEASTTEQVLQNVRAAVNEFVGEAEQFDDLTMLCFEYRGSGKPMEVEDLFSEE